MLVVERGLIEFDDDVAGLLPELGAQGVLKGFEDDGEGGERAVFEERKGAITLRYVSSRKIVADWNEDVVEDCLIAAH